MTSSPVKLTADAASHSAVDRDDVHTATGLDGGGMTSVGSTEPLRCSADGSIIIDSGPPTMSQNGTHTTVSTTTGESNTTNAGAGDHNGIIEGRPYSLSEIPGAHAVFPRGYNHARARELEDQAVAAAAAESRANVQPEDTDEFIENIQVEAYTVPEIDPVVDDLEHQLRESRQQLDVARSQLAGPVVDGVPVPTETEENGGKKRRLAIICSVVLLSVIAVVVGVSVSSTNQANPAPEPVQVKLPPVLETLKERGVLRCGVNKDSGGFSFINEETQVREGFEIDLCKAIAAASFGSANQTYETIDVTPTNRFLTLASGEVDLLIAGTTHTFERDVHQASTGTGFTFSTPYLYGGLSFFGIPEFVACADELSAVGDCANLLICVIPGTTWMVVTKSLFPGPNVVSVPEQPDAIQGLIDGKCNVIVGEQFEAPEKVVRSYGYEGPFAMGENVFSKEPLAIVTRDGDPDFSDFANWVLQGLMHAEEQNVTMQTADTFTNMLSFEYHSKDMFRNAIAAVGNYGEIYSRHLESIVSRLEANKLNKGDTGLLYSHPFGQINTIGKGPSKGGKIEEIVQRGFLRCGITLPDDQTVIEDMQQVELFSGGRLGLDIEYCRAISASILETRTDNISFKGFPKTVDYKTALQNGDIDVFVGGEVTMIDDIGRAAISFSKPYFFETAEGSSTEGKAFSAVTEEDDAQWTDLVYWVIMATFYAEENGIMQTTSNEMPLISLYGPSLERLLRDTIIAVGNYGEMYRRVFGQSASRVGRNLLNVPPYGPQHYPLPFGNQSTDESKGK